MKEEWKDIPEYQGLYQVSNLGKVKRLKGKCLGKAGKYRNISENILTAFPNKTRHNYLYINLNNNGLKQFRLHRLVAQIFIPNPHNLPEVNHIDGNKENNCVDNLEWCTRLENMQHSYKIKTHTVRKHDLSPNNKLNSKQVMEIRTKLKEGTTGRSLSKEYSISEGMISLIKNNKYWI
jgi:hypothetical protein